MCLDFWEEFIAGHRTSEPCCTEGKAVSTLKTMWLNYHKQSEYRNRREEANGRLLRISIFKDQAVGKWHQMKLRGHWIGGNLGKISIMEGIKEKEKKNLRKLSTVSNVAEVK